MRKKKFNPGDSVYWKNTDGSVDQTLTYVLKKSVRRNHIGVSWVDTDGKTQCYDYRYEEVLKSAVRISKLHKILT